MELRKINSSNRGFSIEFENGYAISVVTHEMANCGPGTAEIAILKGGELVDPSVIGENWGDQVLGHVGADDLAKYITKVQSITNEN
jgi:hypothetical protein